MVSIKREDLRKAIKQRPETVLDMAREHGVKLPRYSQVTVGDSYLTFTTPVEFRCDVVLHLKRNDRIVMVIVVGVQLSPGVEKILAWPVYRAV